MSLKGLNVTHLVSRTACWVVIGGPHPSTAPPPRASRWSTAWRTPRTCGRSERHQTEDGMNLETMIVYVLDDWRTDGRPTGRRWRRRSQTSDPTLWWSGTIPPGRVSNCDKAGTGGGERWQWWNMLQTGWSAMFPPVFLKPWKVPELISAFCYSAYFFLPEPQQFEPCSFVSLLPSWLSSKRIGGD